MIWQHSLVWPPLMLAGVLTASACGPGTDNLESDGSESLLVSEVTSSAVTTSSTAVSVESTTSVESTVGDVTTTMSPATTVVASDDVNVGEGDLTIDPAVARFCGLAFEYVDLTSASYEASNLEPYDRDRAALTAAMPDVAPEELSGLATDAADSYEQYVDYLDGRSSLSGSERDEFRQGHLDVSSELHLALLEFVADGCSRMSTDRNFVAAVLAESDEVEDVVTAAPEAPASPSDGGSQDPGGGDASNMPVAGVADWPSDAPDLPTPIGPGITPGLYILASSTWEATDARPAVLLEIYMMVSEVDVVVGTRCDVSAADYPRRNELAIDTTQTHQTPFGPVSFTLFCGMDEQGQFGGFGGIIYQLARVGWRQLTASVTGTFVERGTGLSATVEANVNFADYR